MNRSLRKQIVKSLFQGYLDDIDDFYDAKDELIMDLNKMLHSLGDRDGVVSGEKITELKSSLRNL